MEITTNMDMTANKIRSMKGVCEVRDPYHPRLLLEAMYQCYINNTYCDTLIQTTTGAVYSHSVVLVSASQKLMSLMHENSETNSKTKYTIDLCEIQCTMFSVHAILQYIYKGKFSLNQENHMDKTLELAEYLDLQLVKDICLQYKEQNINKVIKSNNEKSILKNQCPEVQTIAREGGVCIKEQMDLVTIKPEILKVCIEETGFKEPSGIKETGVKGPSINKPSTKEPSDITQTNMGFDSCVAPTSECTVTVSQTESSMETSSVNATELERETMICGNIRRIMSPNNENIKEIPFNTCTFNIDKADKIQNNVTANEQTTENKTERNNKLLCHPGDVDTTYNNVYVYTPNEHKYPMSMSSVEQGQHLINCKYTFVDTSNEVKCSTSTTSDGQEQQVATNTSGSDRISHLLKPTPKDSINNQTGSVENIATSTTVIDDTSHSTDSLLRLPASNYYGNTTFKSHQSPYKGVPLNKPVSLPSISHMLQSNSTTKAVFSSTYGINSSLLNSDQFKTHISGIALTEKDVGQKSSECEGSFLSNNFTSVILPVVTAGNLPVPLHTLLHPTEAVNKSFSSSTGLVPILPHSSVSDIIQVDSPLFPLSDTSVQMSSTIPDNAVTTGTHQAVPDSSHITIQPLNDQKHKATFTIPVLEESCTPRDLGEAKTKNLASTGNIKNSSRSSCFSTNIIRTTAPVSLYHVQTNSAESPVNTTVASATVSTCIDKHASSTSPSIPGALEAFSSVTSSDHSYTLTQDTNKTDNIGTLQDNTSTFSATIKDAVEISRTEKDHIFGSEHITCNLPAVEVANYTHNNKSGIVFHHPTKGSNTQLSASQGVNIQGGSYLMLDNVSNVDQISEDLSSVKSFSDSSTFASEERVDENESSQKKEPSNIVKADNDLTGSTGDTKVTTDDHSDKLKLSYNTERLNSGDFESKKTIEITTEQHRCERDVSHVIDTGDRIDDSPSKKTPVEQIDTSVSEEKTAKKPSKRRLSKVKSGQISKCLKLATGKKEDTQGDHKNDAKKGSTVRPSGNKEDEELFNCTECSMKYSTEKELLDHNKHHSPLRKNKFTCSICGLKFPNSVVVQEHQKKDHVFPFMCPEKGCKFGFNTERKLMSHRHSKHHLQLEQLEAYFPEKYKLYKCQFGDCKYKSLEQSCVKYHIKTTHGNERPFTCDICGDKFKAKTTMVSHKLNIHQEKKDSERPQCEECGKHFKTHNSMVQHRRRVHEGVKNSLPCEHCDFVGYDRRNLLTHAWYTHGVEPPDKYNKFVCKECGYKCLQKGAFQIHLKRHAGVRSFMCELCGRGYISESELRNHREYHKDPTARQFKCDQCAFSAVNLVKLKKHVKISHTDPDYKPYACVYVPCDYRTNIRGNLVMHMRNTHKLEVETRKTIQGKVLKTGRGLVNPKATGQFGSNKPEDKVKKKSGRPKKKANKELSVPSGNSTNDISQGVILQQMSNGQVNQSQTDPNVVSVIKGNIFDNNLPEVMFNIPSEDGNSGSITVSMIKLDPALKPQGFVPQSNILYDANSCNVQQGMVNMEKVSGGNGDIGGKTQMVSIVKPQQLAANSMVTDLYNPMIIVPSSVEGGSVIHIPQTGLVEPVNIQSLPQITKATVMPLNNAQVPVTSMQEMATSSTLVYTLPQIASFTSKINSTEMTIQPNIPSSVSVANTGPTGEGYNDLKDVPDPGLLNNLLNDPQVIMMQPEDLSRRTVGEQDDTALNEYFLGV